MGRFMPSHHFPSHLFYYNHFIITLVREFKIFSNLFNESAVSFGIYLFDLLHCSLPDQQPSREAILEAAPALPSHRLLPIRMISLARRSGPSAGTAWQLQPGDKTCPSGHTQAIPIVMLPRSSIAPTPCHYPGKAKAALICHLVASQGRCSIPQKAVKEGCPSGDAVLPGGMTTRK